MPEMDGFDLAERVQRDRGLHGVTFILLTSAGQREDQSRAKIVRAAAAVTKPVKQSELWDAIVTALHVPGRLKIRPWPREDPHEAPIAGCGYWWRRIILLTRSSRFTCLNAGGTP